MPKLYKFGPESKGLKTGRMLGHCRKTEDELKQIGELGRGQGKRYHSKNISGPGNGRPTNYFQTINNKV